MTASDLTGTAYGSSASSRVVGPPARFARDGDRTRLRPKSLGPASQFVVDHAPCPALLVWPLPAPGLASTRPRYPARRVTGDRAAAIVLHGALTPGRRLGAPGLGRNDCTRRLVVAMYYRAEVRLTVADVGKRIVLRWRRPASGGRDEVADVLGMLEAADGASFTVRKASGELVVIPIERALAGKVVPPAPRR